MRPRRPSQPGRTDPDRAYCLEVRSVGGNRACLSVGHFAIMLTMSARMKLVHDPLAVEVIGGVVGVPLRLFPVLALLEVAGGVGRLAGIGLKPLGVAPGTGLVAYFIAAIASHLSQARPRPGPHRIAGDDARHLDRGARAKAGRVMRGRIARKHD